MSGPGQAAKYSLPSVELSQTGTLARFIARSQSRARETDDWTSPKYELICFGDSDLIIDFDGPFVYVLARN